jgi:hypothetical protein
MAEPARARPSGVTRGSLATKLQPCTLAAISSAQTTKLAATEGTSMNSANQTAAGS